MTVPHHSEPARAGADAYDNMVAWMSMNAPYHHMMTFKAALERSASTAPAAGGLEAVLREVADAARQMPRETPAPGSCVTVHQFPIEAGVVWTLDRALNNLDAALASPAATSAETQGGDGVREALEFARKVIAGRPEKSLADNFALHRIDAALAQSTSAAPVESAQVKVKPLEWESGDGIVHDALSWRAVIKPLGLTYCVVERQWWLVGEHGVANVCESDEAAKAAAQADYEARIRASLATDAEG